MYRRCISTTPARKYKKLLLRPMQRKAFSFWGTPPDLLIRDPTGDSPRPPTSPISVIFPEILGVWISLTTRPTRSLTFRVCQLLSNLHSSRPNAYTCTFQLPLQQNYKNLHLRKIYVMLQGSLHMQIGLQYTRTGSGLGLSAQ